MSIFRLTFDFMTIFSILLMLNYISKIIAEVGFFLLETKANETLDLHLFEILDFYQLIKCN